MLRMRLQRIGKKHQPSFRLTVSEARSKMAGPPVEDLGSYNSFTKAANFKKERIEYWLGVGAKPGTTVHNLLVKEGILKAKKLAVKIGKSKDKGKAESEPVVAAPAAAV